jgi:deoxyribodipyrimidine photo-lyase
MREKIVVFWFRRDLRIADNTGFYQALVSGKKVLPIFIFDPSILEKLDNKEDARVTFIHDQVQDINQTFIRHGSGLRVEIGDPLAIYQAIIEEYEIEAIFTNRDYEPYAVSRDHKIATLCGDNGIEFKTFKDHVIFEKGEILTDSGQPYKVFTPYKNKWLEHFSNGQVSFPSQDHLQNLIRLDGSEIPSLQQIGFSRSTIEIPSKSLDEGKIKRYSETRDYPSLDGTSRLGVHLRHGTLSIRQAISSARNHSSTWLNELIWREFYIMILAHFPHVVDRAFKSQYDRISWRNNEMEFDSWCRGMTGYPIVDAGIRELVSTGYMHNRVRMITASFLTKHLLIDWRWGEAFFAKHLLDFELASNNGGWQWAAGTGTDAQPYFRVFNPTLQTKKFDEDLSYIRKWIPELDSLDYPAPIVEHKFARERAIRTYKEALA